MKENSDLTRESRTHLVSGQRKEGVTRGEILQSWLRVFHSGLHGVGRGARACEGSSGVTHGGGRTRWQEKGGVDPVWRDHSRACGSPVTTTENQVPMWKWGVVTRPCRVWLPGSWDRPQLCSWSRPEGNAPLSDTGCPGGYFELVSSWSLGP